MNKNEIIDVESTLVPKELDPEQVKQIENRLRETQYQALLWSALGDANDNLPEQELIKVIYFISLGYAASSILEFPFKHKLNEIYKNNMSDIIENMMFLGGVRKQTAPKQEVTSSVDTSPEVSASTETQTPKE